jgi:thiol-disulfide isomerase/thioredoxin
MLEKTAGIKTFVLISAFLFSFSVYALGPGDEAPELAVKKWVKNGPVRIYLKKPMARFYVIEFWATWSRTCRDTIPLLNYLQKKYRDKRVLVAAISSETEAELKKFLDGSKEEFIYALGIDGENDVGKAYMDVTDTVIPKAFIVDSIGTILWKGDPVDLDRVMGKIIAGDFDLDKQKKISLLHQEMRVALQSGAVDAIVKSSNKILEIDPADGLAVRGRLFVYEKRAQYKDALQFIDELIKTRPEYSRFYFLKLEMLIRQGVGRDDFAKVAETIFQKFKNDPDVMSELAWKLMEELPFGMLPANIAFKAAAKAVNNYHGDDVEKIAAFKETLGRAYALQGRLKEAEKLQSEVCKKLTGTSGYKHARQILDYYRELVKFNNRK